MRAAKVQASLRIRAVSPEPLLLAHTSSESRGTFRQKARSLAPLNGWACAVKICHDGMLEDTNSLDGAHLIFTSVNRNPGTSIVYSCKQNFCCMSQVSWITVMIRSVLIDRSRSDQSLHCLPFCLHLLNAWFYGKTTLLEFYDNFGHPKLFEFYSILSYMTQCMALWKSCVFPHFEPNTKKIPTAMGPKAKKWIKSQKQWSHQTKTFEVIPVRVQAGASPLLCASL